MKYVLRENLTNEENSVFNENYPEILKKLLYYRGLRSEKEASDFLNPDYTRDFHDSFLMKDMDKAVERIIEAIDNREKVLIYSDYDADGIPGAVILADFFRRIGFKNFENYIPHRHNEGFGLHLEAIEEFKERGVNLLITIDCGTSDISQVDRAVALGIDVIITDHHEAADRLPNALAVLNPKRSDCSYPFDALCGAGVVFKLVQALMERKDFGLKKGTEKWFLDMAGIATLSDMVSLTGENRAISYFGLKVLRVSKREGLRRLIKKLNLNQENLAEDDVGFSITPRINAASRMGLPDDAFGLLFSKEPEEAGGYLTRLEKVNNERKGIVAALFKEIKKNLERKNFNSEKDGLIVMGNPNWRPSLLGLVANSVAGSFNCPVFLWGRDGGQILKGSCRSDGKLNLVAFMEKQSDLFIDFGGHKMAGGFSVSDDNIHYLEDRLKDFYKKNFRQETLEEENIFIDSRLLIDDVNLRTYSVIERLSPFGVGNPKPVFLFEKLKVKSAKRFGKELKHFEAIFEKTDGRRVKAIRFFTDDSLDERLSEGKEVNLIANIEKSYFAGYSDLRLNIIDVI